MTFQIEEATIDGIHDAMRAGEVTSAALVDAYRDRIEAIRARALGRVPARQASSGTVGRDAAANDSAGNGR